MSAAEATGLEEPAPIPLLGPCNLVARVDFTPPPIFEEIELFFFSS